ncbi:MAG: hypothetical protein AAFO62_04980, partial [Pseudomonadota bacterium]
QRDPTPHAVRRSLKRVWRRDTRSLVQHPQTLPRSEAMHGIIYLIGLIVVVMAVLSLIGLA